jgi:hypothetical protein
MPRKRSEQFFITRARELDESDLWEHLFERMASALLPDGFETHAVLSSISKAVKAARRSRQARLIRPASAGIGA